VSNKKTILLSITNGLWLIDTQSAHGLGANVAAVLKGESFWNTKHESKHEITILNTDAVDAFVGNTSSSIKPNSVAVVPISGPVMKYDNCGDPGTQTFSEMLQALNANPNITGIILQIDSPGGEVRGTQQLADVIKSLSKPVVTLAEDLMASAAYWIGSSANFVFANNNTTRIGSIGTMLSFADMQPAWEKEGVVFHEIYATKSTQKNKDFADARKGDYKAVIDNTLDPLNNEFLTAVKNNRGSKLDQSKTLNGQVYLAQDALTYGLIDAIGNLNDAVAKVYELAGANKNQSNQTHSQIENDMKIKISHAHTALLAVLGIATLTAGANHEEVEITEEVAAKINSALADASTVSAALTTEKEAHAVTTAKLERLAAANPGASNAIKLGADKIEESNQDENFECEIDEELQQIKQKLGITTQK
jgi:signal peptide peptidase SppA